MHPDDHHSDGNEPGARPPEGLPILHQDDVDDGQNTTTPLHAAGD